MFSHSNKNYTCRFQKILFGEKKAFFLKIKNFHKNEIKLLCNYKIWRNIDTSIIKNTFYEIAIFKGQPQH